MNIGILASGSGSNFEQIVLSKIKNANIKILICNNKNAFVIERAKKYNIDYSIIEHNRYNSRKDFENEIVKKLQEYNVELVILAGFMRVLTSNFLNKFPKKVINIHPTLLPSFPGINSVEQVLEHGVKITGVTVHFVDNGVDTGPIIAQRSIIIDENDNLESLSQKIHKVEHELYPEVINLAVNNKLKIIGRKVNILK